MYKFNYFGIASDILIDEVMHCNLVTGMSYDNDDIITATVTNGGITLIIGAFEVDYDNGQIAFLIMKIILMAVITLSIIIVIVGRYN